jgi:hypothetical protein
MAFPPQALADDVAREIIGTNVLWAAVPDPWGYARSRWKSALAGIPVTAFAAFWTWGVAGGFVGPKGNSPPAFFVLFGFIVLGTGLSMLLSPVYAFWKAGRVFYVVTEQSAIIFEKPLLLKIQSFDASGFGGFERVSRGDGEGDILFQRTIERRGRGGTEITEVGFIGLLDYAEAERALRSMIKGKKGQNNLGK